MSGCFQRRRLLGLAVLIGIAALAIPMQLSAAEPTQSGGESTGTNHIVSIKDLQFSPEKLQVKMGDTITWVNNDFIPHTATAIDKSWDSKNLAKGESFSLVVDENTLLDYFCVYHPNMVATIELLSDE